MNKLLKTAWLALAAAAILVSPELAAADGEPERPTEDNGKKALTGPFLGQPPPHETPVIFAPGIVSTEQNEHLGPTFAPDGDTIVWSVFSREQTFRITSRKAGRWEEPRWLPFNQPFKEDGPYFSPDGKRLYFFSQRPSEEGGAPNEDWDIWWVERSGSAWSRPHNLGPPVNSDKNEVFHAVTANGALYFCTLGPPRVMYRSEMVDGRYQSPQRLPDSINTGLFYSHPYVAPDESYIIFSAERQEGLGSADLYVAFRGSDNQWSRPANLGAPINTSVAERSPSVTPDGKYLFLVRHQLTDRGGGYCCGDVYWVSAGIIEELKVSRQW